MSIWPQSLLLIVFLAVILDALIGDPDWLWHRLPHPVVWHGKLIGFLDTNWNRQDHSDGMRRAFGIAMLVLLLGASFAVGLLLQWVFGFLGVLGLFLTALVGAVFLAQKSLYQHVRAVEDPLALNDLPAARHAVSMIVGRNPARLDEPGVARAAIESLAENFSDGIVAPLFWFLLGGLPGLITYKALNTADSMVGHRTVRHEAFGWAAARLDDVANYIPARLCMLLLMITPTPYHQRDGRGFRSNWQVIKRDAPLHRSPNAGWPEAAMAARLGIALSGPRSYGEVMTDDPFVNDEGKRDIGAAEIGAALGLYRHACGLQAGIILVLALLSGF